MQKSSARTRHTLLVAALAALAVVVALVAWALIEPQLLLVDATVFASPQVPEELDGMRIAFVSDIHEGGPLTQGRTRRIVDRVNSLRPDLVLLGGDYASRGTDGTATVYPELARLVAPHGVIAVLGNHDTGANAGASREGLAAAGAILLENDHARIRRGGSSMVVAGVEDATTAKPDVAQAAQDVSPGSFAILLSHSPDVLPDGLDDAPNTFDLALAGHTHGGQITLFGLWAPYLPSAYGQQFRGGWTRVGTTPTLVSRGTGTFGPPMRFFAPPQIHLIELRRGEANETP